MRILLALLLIAWPLAAETYLVCAGVETYDDPGISPLRYAVADVKAVAAAFRDAGVPEGNITLLTSDAADRRKLPTKASLLWALHGARSQARADDTLLFFFSGHGLERNGEPYLLTFDSNAEMLDQTALAMSVVNQALRGFQGANLLLVIDACRNDPDAGKAAGNAALDESFAKGLRPRLQARPAGEREPNVALLLACEVGQRAWEMPEKGQGAFTWWLLEGLRHEAPRTAEQVDLAALAAYLEEQVPAWAKRAGRSQTPRFEQVSGGGFALPAPATAELQPTQAILEVSSTPPGAAVYLDGQDSGRKTDCELTVELGVARERLVEVGLQLAGHAAKVATIKVQRGQRLPLALTLDPTAPAPARPTGAGPKPAGWPVYLNSFTPPAGTTWSSFRVSPKDGMPQVLIPAGEFTMGTTPEQLQAALRIEGMTAEYAADEQPAKRVYLSAYWMDLHEVTVGQYKRFCAATGRSVPENLGADSHPVVNVSWEDATAYATWAGRELPTEAQWEKAARGGTNTQYPWGDQFDPALANQGGDGTVPVGTYAPNGYGLYDMAGNVLEWCRDWYDNTWYQKMPARDPHNVAEDLYRVCRGGSWFDFPSYLRVASRDCFAPDFRSPGFGFRCAASAP